MRRSTIMRGGAAGALLASAALLTGCATAGAPGPLTATMAPPAEAVPEERIIDGLAPEEQGYPIMDGALATWSGDLQMWLESQPDGGAVVLGEGYESVSVTWFGEPTAELLALLAEAPDGVEVRIQSADFRPSELQRLVPLGLRDRAGDGMKVVAGWPANDGSGVGFGIEELPEGLELDDAARILAARIGRDDVPIEVELMGPIVPAAG